MNVEFWLDRWRKKEIGFHEGRPGDAMQRYWPSLGLASGSRIFVPLCGKSLDLVWLAARGHKVVGIEISDLAVREFFEENQLSPRVEARGNHTVSRDGGVEIWQGDYFEIDQTDLGAFDGFYDRAALIAMPPAMQPAYAAQMARLCTIGTRGLLVVTEYDQTRMSGPPFSVAAERVRELYAAQFDVEELDRFEALDASPRLRERGLAALTTIVLRLTRR